MASIISNDNALILNDRASISRSSFSSEISGDLVIIKSNCGSVRWQLDYRKDTVDGDSFDSAQELFDSISAFTNGGGDGTIGVADITGLNAGNLIFGGASGNEQRKINPDDLNVSYPQGLDYIPFRGSTGNWGVYSASYNSAPARSIARRTDTGAGYFNPATADNESVILNQFKGIVNSTLTDSETSATLQALYASQVVGTVVTATTALTEYRKISPTQWTKKTLTIV